MRVCERVPELAAFVDRAWCLGRGVARNAAWEGELAEELAKSRFILGHMRVKLCIRPLEIGVRDDGRAPMPGPVT